MKVPSALLVAVTFVATMTLGLVTDVEAKKPQNPLVLPATGTGDDGTFNGTVSIHRFIVQDGAIKAVAVIAGVVTGSGTPRVVVSDPITLPVTPTVTAASAGPGILQLTCGILHLEIGGISLNFLGLAIMVSPVIIDVAGGEGPLGELVCQIVALLGTVADVVGLLNQLLGLLLGLLGGLVPGA